MKTILIATLLVAASLILPVAHAEPSDADTKKLAALRTQAEKGDAEAFYDLGAALLVGNLGIAKDEVEAVKWLRKAAEQNLAEAQYNLGRCYADGIGVAKDHAVTYKWWLLAAAQNLENSKNHLPKLESLMTREQIAAGKHRADDWLKQRKNPPTDNP